MNLQHMKYAVAVAETGSINKAADRLFVGQSNLSRAIKELENSLGVAIFERSAHGMELTPEGGVFLRYAKAILQQVDEVEHMFTEGSAKKKHFSISVPRSSYISEAFARFSCELSADEEFEVFYKETNAMRTLKNVLQDDYKLGILRYAENYDRYYKELVEEKGLRCELVAEFRYALLMSKDCPLAQQESITYEDLKNYIRVIMPIRMSPRCRLPKCGGKSCRMISTGASMSLSGPAALNCFPATRKLLCGFHRFRRNCWRGIRWYTAPVWIAAAGIRMCSSTGRTTHYLHWISSSSRSLLLPSGSCRIIGISKGTPALIAGRYLMYKVIERKASAVTGAFCIQFSLAVYR